MMKKPAKKLERRNSSINAELISFGENRFQFEYRNDCQRLMTKNEMEWAKPFRLFGLCAEGPHLILLK
jgi:hypothetical protein